MKNAKKLQSKPGYGVSMNKGLNGNSKMDVTAINDYNIWVWFIPIL